MEQINKPIAVGTVIEFISFDEDLHYKKEEIEKLSIGSCYIVDEIVNHISMVKVYGVLLSEDQYRVVK